MFIHRFQAKHARAVRSIANNLRTRVQTSCINLSGTVRDASWRIVFEKRFEHVVVVVSPFRLPTIATIRTQRYISHLWAIAICSE